MAKMPPNQPWEFTGPWGGISNLVSAKQIIPSDFASANNVTNIGGRIAPRPGYSTLTDAPLSVVQIIVAGKSDTSTASGVIAMKIDQSNGRAYYTNETDAHIWSRSVSSGSSTDEVDTGKTAGTLVDIDLDSTYLYFADQTTRKVWRVTRSGWGSITDMTTITAGHVITGMCIDATNNKIWTIGYNGLNLTLHSAPLNSTVTTATLVGTVGTSSGGAAARNSIKVDSTGTYLYFTGDGQIYRSTTAAPGTVTTLYSATASGVDEINGLALDEANAYIYFVYNPIGGERGKLMRITTSGAGAITWLDPVGAGFPSKIDRQTSTGRILVADGATDAPEAGIYLVSAPTDFQIISSFWINRSVLDVDESASEYAKDIVLLQLISSSFSRQMYAAYFPTAGKKYVLEPGYISAGAATDIPNLWVSKDRTTAISTSYAANSLSTTSGRATFAWTGAGINTGKGGLLIADGDDQRVFNYVLGDTVQTVTITGSPTGGTFTLTYDGETTATIGYNAPASHVREGLEDLNAINGVVVTGSAGGPYTVRFTGSLSGQNAETLTGDASGLTGGTDETVDIAVTQVGGTDTDATLYLRPAGLPYPPSLSVASVGVASGILTGYFEYYATYYSTTWDIESPPSVDNALALLTTESVDLTITRPSTMYFEGDAGSTYAIPNGPLIDRWRLYRRRRGSYAGGTTGGGDGVDADPTWYLIADIPLGSGAYPYGTLTYRDNTADTGIDFSSPLPIDNAWPPQDAQWVEICNGRSVWASARSDDTNIWPSELQKAGGVANGEFGYEYVSDFKFFQPEFLAATDTPITGIKTYNGLLYIGTEKEVVATTLDGVDTVGPSIIRLRGVGGFASQWMIGETTSLPNQPGNLFWVSPNGWVYSFNGAQTQLLSRKIDATSRTFARQYWHATSYFPSAFTNNWYWCSALCDPIRNKFLFTAPVDGGANIIVDYCLDFDAWFKWSIPAYATVLGREWSGSTGKGEPLVCFSDANGYLYKLKDGKADNGTAFEWTYSTAKLDFGMPLRRKLIHEAMMGFDVRSFGGSNPAVVVAANLNDNATVTGNSTTVSTATNAQAGVAPKNTKVRHLQLSVTGTQSSDLSHPELVGALVHFEPDVGEARE